MSRNGNATLAARALTAEIEDGMLVIRLPLQTPTPSMSGKTLVVASTHGAINTEAQVNGKPVTIGVNAWIK